MEQVKQTHYMTPRHIFFVFLQKSYGLSEEMAEEATEFAIDLFELDYNGKLPIDWELWYRNQA